MRRLQPPSPRTQATYVSPIVSKHRRRRRGRGVGCSCPYWSAMDIDAGRLRDKSWTAWAIMLLGALQGQSSQSKTARNRATGRENPCAAERTPGDRSRDIHSFGCFSVLDGLNVQLDPCNALVRPVQHQNRNLWESEHRIAADYPDPGSQPSLDDVAALAACICETPYASVCLIEGVTHLSSAQVGLTAAQAAQALTLCTLLRDEKTPVAVSDALHDARVRDHPLVVGEPHIRFFFGVTIRNSDDPVLAMLCVLDRTPRQLNTAQQHALQLLAAQSVTRLRFLDRLSELKKLCEESAQMTAASRHLAAIVESSDDAIIGNDLDGVVTSWNQGAERMLGFSAEEVIGSSIRRIVPPNLQDEEDRIRFAIRNGRRLNQIETLRRAKDGRLVSVSLMASPIKDVDGKIVGASKVFRDLTASHERESNAERLLRVYTALRQINQAIVRMHTRDELLQTACRVLVDVGGFALAWIGFYSPQTRLIEPVATYGNDDGRVQGIRTYDDRPEDPNPAESVLRSGANYVCNDLLADTAIMPWHVEAKRRGFRAMAAFPIRDKDIVDGTLNVYSAQPDCFGSKEISLLEQVAGDVSFGLDNLAREEHRRVAELSVKRERRFSDVMIESLPGILYFYDDRGRFLRWNRNFEIASGYSAEEIAQMHPLDFFAHADKALLEERIAEVFKGGAATVEAPLRAKDGSTTPYFFTGRRVDLDGAVYLVGMGIDVSARTEAEKARRLSEARYQTLFDCAPEGIIIADTNSVYLDANAAMCQMLGYSRDELIGLNASHIVDASEMTHVEPAINTIRAGVDYSREWLFRRKDGSRFTAEVVGTLTPDGNLMGIVRDITERKDHERKIIRLNRIRAVAAAISSAMLRTHDRDALLQEACRVAVQEGVFPFAWASVFDHEVAAARIVAMDGVDADSRNFIESLAQLTPPHEQPDTQALLTGKCVVINDLLAEQAFAALRKIMQARACRAAAVFPLFAGGRPVAALSLLARQRNFFDEEELALLNWLTKDLSYALESIDNAQRLEHLAYFDALTGLANDNLFRDRLAQYVFAAEHSAQKVCVVAIDLENFTHVNETLGREGGDELLRAVAARLQNALLKPYAIGRIGADTFVVARSGDDELIATSLQEQITEVFSVPFSVQGLEMVVYAQTGIALFPDDAHDQDTLFKRAEAARAACIFPAR
ncbi:MAG: PAS domain S-box protein [Gammaproteobacteria bacterium]|nr:MAG: PAS domain S-box protein [Gammaproteobacteria bacterium]